MTNSKRKHTPGPWTVKEEADSVRRIDADNGCMIARTIEVNSRAKLHGEIPHNARLIAAAPDMLAALERLEIVCSGASDDSLTAAVEQARDAIDKATGR